MREVWVTRKPMEMYLDQELNRLHRDGYVIFSILPGETVGGARHVIIVARLK